MKFQKIVDCLNGRDPDLEQALSGVKLYVWRTFPRIDAAKTGRKTTNVLMLDCVNTNEGNTTVTPLPANVREFVTQQLGGGRYRLSLNDKTQEAIDGNKGQPDTLCQTALKIDHTEHAPILDPREIDETDPETAQWVVRQLSLNQLVRTANGLVLPTDRTAAPLAAARNGAGDTGETGLAAVALEAIKQRSESTSEKTMKASLDLMSGTATKMIEQAQKSAASPELLISLAGALRGNPDGGIAAMIPLLTAMMDNQAKMQMHVMTLIMQRNEAAAPQDTGTGIGVVEKLLEMAERQKGGGWLDTLKEMLPMIMPLMLGKMLQSPGGAAPDMSGLANLMAARNGATPGAGAPPAADGPVQVTPQLIQAFAARAWACMSRGQDGSDLANGIEVFFTPAHYDALHDLGKAQLMAQLLQTPQAPNFQNAGAAFEQFIEEFLGYGEQSGEGEETAEPPPMGPQPVRTAPAGAV